MADLKRIMAGTENTWMALTTPSSSPSTTVTHLSLTPAITLEMREQLHVYRVGRINFPQFSRYRRLELAISMRPLLRARRNTGRGQDQGGHPTWGWGTSMASGVHQNTTTTRSSIVVEGLHRRVASSFLGRTIWYPDAWDEESSARGLVDKILAEIWRPNSHDSTHQTIVGPIDDESVYQRPRLPLTRCYEVTTGAVPLLGLCSGQTARFDRAPM